MLTNGVFTIGTNSLLDLDGAALSATGGYIAATNTSDLSIQGTTGGTVTLLTSANISLRNISVSGTRTLAMNGLHNLNLKGNLIIGVTAAFNTGGESQVIDGGGAIIISGTFIKKDEDGFTGTNTSIPGINPVLNAGCTIEYGLATGNPQMVIARNDYQHIKFSGTGVKTLSSGFNPTGTVFITGNAVVNAASHTFGNGATNLNMNGGRLLLSGTNNPQPHMAGSYQLTGGVIEFACNSVGGMILFQRDYWETPSGEIPYNVLGTAARVTYGYDNRYLAEINMGYNGSEQFAPSKRFGFFPAVSVGWVVSNEHFLENNQVITNLKLRASYGKVGNDQMGGARFLYQSNITLGGGPLGSLGLGQTVNQGLLGNPNISWEVAKKQNYGIDMQLLKEIDISVDYFIENRSDILISRGTVPEFQGVGLGNIPKVNMGLVDNSGYEIELTYNKPMAKDLKLMVRGNYSYNHNKVKFLDEQIRDESYASRYTSTGYSLNQNFGYKIDYSNGNGYFNSTKELDDYLAKTTYGFGTPRIGDFKYMDINGDGIVNDKDQVAIGYSNIPRVSFGLTLNLQYKAFDVTGFIQGVGKYSSNYAQQGVYETIKLGTYFDYHKNAWTAERYANGDKITYPALSTLNNTNHTANDFFIMDRSFIRLRNIEIAYTLPEKVLKVAGLKRLRFYASAQNLFTWDHLKMGHLDPENDDPIGYPVTKMINFGMNITL